MAADWNFYQQQATDPIRNPIAGEFFSTEAVKNVAEALIRESIQNTLDARVKHPNGSRDRGVARVYLSETAGALSPTRAQRWFRTLWPHVTSPRNGLRGQPSLEEPCPFLVFEDFGTIGLTGDPEAYKVVDGVHNHFLNFFRAEGYSDKGEQDRGSWGVGKSVFPRASRISTFFGLTVRGDDQQRLLLGRSILKYHRVDGLSYKSDGYFGVAGNEGFMLPCNDTPTLKEFCGDFRVTRKDEPGLSLVVPWYDVAGEERLTRDMMVEAVLRGFFYPILMGHLDVTIATPVSEMILDAGSIIRQVDVLGGDIARDLLPVLHQTEWAQTRKENEFKHLVGPTSGSAQRWRSDQIPAEVIEHIRDSLAQRRRVALRVPMTVQPKTSVPRPTFFNVFLEYSDRDSEKPAFIREELIIPDVRSRRIPNVRSMVIVEDGPLAAFLRDAETPAHTQWNPETGNFKNKYKFGPGGIDFVRHSVYELLHIVNETEQGSDPSLTIDFFSLPASPEDDDAVPARRRQARLRPGDGPEPPVQPPPPQPKRFRIQRTVGGFSITAGDATAALPSYLEIKMAYDVRHGNPLRRYHPADFDVAQKPIRWESPGDTVKVRTAAGNRMLVTVQRPDFRLDVTGFDPERDLYVKAEVKEAVDVDPAP